MSIGARSRPDLVGADRGSIHLSANLGGGLNPKSQKGAPNRAEIVNARGFLFLSKKIEELGYCCPKILIYANRDNASGRENSGIYGINTRR